MENKNFSLKEMEELAKANNSNIITEINKWLESIKEKNPANVAG